MYEENFILFFTSVVIIASLTEPYYKSLPVDANPNG
jgi:hypothetical protein